MRVRLPPPAPASLLSKRSISLTSFCPLTATRAGGGEENPQEGCGETSPPTDTCRAAAAGRPRAASARRRLPPPAPEGFLDACGDYLRVPEHRRVFEALRISLSASKSVRFRRPRR